METKYPGLLLIIFFLCILFFNCSDHSTNNKSSTNSSNVIANLPDSEIYDFSYKYTEKDKLIWELNSKKAEVFSKQGMKKIDGVDLKFYKNGRINSTLVSKFGEINENTKLLTAISNVVLKTTDGKTLYTEILHWNDVKKELFTYELIKIVQANGEVITAVGMIADIGLEKVKFLKDVEGEFHEKK